MAMRRRQLFELAFESLSPHTKRAYEGDWSRFGRWWEGRGFEEAVTDFVALELGEARELAMRYRNHLRDTHKAPATVARALTALNEITKRFQFAGVCSWPGSLSIPIPKVQSYRDTTGPSEGEWGDLLTSLREDGSPKGVRDLAIILLLRDSALRRGEVCSLRLEDVDLSRGRLWILGKGDIEREAFPMNGPTRRALEAWLEVRGPAEGALFTPLTRKHKISKLTHLCGRTVYQIVQSRGAAIGLELHPHDLRHSGITAAAKRWKGSMMGLVAFSRHKNPSTVQIYVDDVDDAPQQIADLIGEDSEA